MQHLDSALLGSATLRIMHAKKDQTCWERIVGETSKRLTAGDLLAVIGLGVVTGDGIEISNAPLVTLDPTNRNFCYNIADETY